MKLGKALENYLKAILILKKKQGEQNVRSTDVAAFLEVSKPSVSHAMKVLKENGYITMNEHYYIFFTEKGYKIAAQIYEYYLFFVERLEDVGVDRETAEKEACRIEHCISEESFQKLKKSVGNKASG